MIVLSPVWQRDQKQQQSLGVKAINYSFPKPGGWTNPISPLYEVGYNKNYSKSFVDFQHDVKCDDVTVSSPRGIYFC